MSSGSDDTSAATGWWRTAVIYQVYPRSFADTDGDGIGDLAGVTAHLDDLAELGVDALWLSPFYPSPQKDAGYDVADYCDVDPIFGTLADFDRLLQAAHARSLRVIVDLVPNHSSDRHHWFQAALCAGPGSPERARYLFRDGRGPRGEEPPNNWQSVFGGPAWTRVTEADGRPGQWYLHIFDSSQPDFDWSNPVVETDFEDILRFWLDRGVDGFRVDVAHGMVKAEGLPDRAADLPADTAHRVAPYWNQPGVHDVFRQWRAVLDEYPGDRILCAEAWLPTLRETAQWVRPDEMHQAFNFVYMEAGWTAREQRDAIQRSLQEFAAVGAPSTWVLSNHDIVRHATRLALPAGTPQGHGIGPSNAPPFDPTVGLQRARAATALMLSLPGSAYLYQGEELGLPEVIDLPDEAREDPTWKRTQGERYGRDGCRVPLPWTAGQQSFGFSPTGAPWLPQPPEWSYLSRDAQKRDDRSTLQLYRRALELRARFDLGSGAITKPLIEGDVLRLCNGAVTVMTNFGEDVPLPTGFSVLLSSHPDAAGVLRRDATVWLITQVAATA